MIEEALAGESSAEQLERARALLTERGLDADSEQARSRALSLLARRGFPLEVAYEAVRAHERHASTDG